MSTKAEIILKLFYCTCNHSITYLSPFVICTCRFIS